MDLNNKDKNMDLKNKNMDLKDKNMDLKNKNMDYFKIVSSVGGIMMYIYESFSEFCYPKNQKSQEILNYDEDEENIPWTELDSFII